MKRCLVVSLALVILSVLLFGCTGASKERKMRCPKCAGFYQTKEGAEEFRHIQSR